MTKYVLHSNDVNGEYSSLAEVIRAVLAMGPASRRSAFIFEWRNGKRHELHMADGVSDTPRTTMLLEELSEGM